jgi:hypothetical protein
MSKKRIEVRSQAEFDACIADGNIAIVIGCSVEARENSSVEAWGNSSVVARGNSSVEARGNSSVVAWENSSVEAWGYVFIRLFRALRIRASIGVVIMRHDEAKAEIEGDATIVERSLPTTAEEWCTYHGIEVKDGVAVLYKALGDDFQSPHGGDYKPGTTPVASDWDDGRRECGGGLHFSPTPAMARSFKADATKYVACPVSLADMRSPQSGDQYPEKIKAKGVCAPCYECDKSGKAIQLTEHSQ